MSHQTTGPFNPVAKLPISKDKNLGSCSVVFQCQQHPVLDASGRGIYPQAKCHRLCNAVHKEKKFFPLPCVKLLALKRKV